MKRTHVVLSLLCALALVGCSSGKKKLELGGSCSLNSDCTDGLQCKFGACHKACVKSVDCATGERCVQVDGIAVCQMVSEGSCDQYGNCHTPLSCRAVDNTCRNKCPTGNECLPGQICSATFCIESTEVVANPDASVPSPDATVGPDASTPVSPDAASDRPQSPDAPTGPDAGTPGEAGGLQTCVDQDGDGYGAGAGCRGTDCDDTNTNVWAACGTCVDSDSDGYFLGCDRYSTIKGPDCDDTAPFCTDSCADGDKNGTADCAEYWSGQGATGKGFKSSDGNLLFVGMVDDVGFGSYDIQLIKISPSGRVLWRRLYGTSAGEPMLYATQLADGSLFVSAGIGTANPLTPLYVRLGQDGSVLASKSVPGAKVAFERHASVPLATGGVVVDGWAGSDPWVGELSNDLLTFSWVSRLGGVTGSFVTGMVRLAGGDLMAVLNQGGKGGLARLSSQGEVRWARSGLGGADALLELSPNDGNLVLTDIGVGKPFSVTKLTPDGDVVWSRASANSGDDSGTGGLLTALAIGTDGAIFASALNNPKSTKQYSWLVKLDSSGRVDWTRRTAGKQAQVDYLLLPDATGTSLVLSGWGGASRVGSNPDTSCVVAPETDTLKAATPSYTSMNMTSTAATPWTLTDYPLSTMPGTLTWKQICPAKP